MFILLLYMCVCIIISISRWLYVILYITPTISPTVLPSLGYSSRSPTILPSVTKNAKIQRIYINIEDESPNRFFSINHYENIQYLLNFIIAANNLDIQVGIYTTKNDWLNIMTNKIYNNQISLSTSNVYYVYPTSNISYLTYNPFSMLPLWVPKYDSASNMVDILYLCINNIYLNSYIYAYNIYCMYRYYI